MHEVDLLIVGAGPAGMAAAVAVSQVGLKVLLLDEQPGAGGQIYRSVTRTDPRRLKILGADYAHGADLAAALAASEATHVSGATVWQMQPSRPDDATFDVTFSVAGVPRTVRARKLLLATGALERPVSLPGWTLPGVMTAGAAQILIKTSGLLANRAVLAGSGPLIYLLAAQMLRAGKPPLALVETQTGADFRAALRHLQAALAGWRTLLKGIGLLAELRRGGVRRIIGASGLAIEGVDHAEALSFTAGGRRRRIDCDTVLLHQGVVPNTQAGRSLGLAHDWDERQRCFYPKLDPWGESSLPGVFVAGDGAGISGAIAAEHAGRIAGLRAASQLGTITEAALLELTRDDVHALARERILRPFLDCAYPPSPEIRAPDDATIICRCEEVTAGTIRAIARACDGPNQTKAFSRVGMGPCQGRYCGLTVTEILAEATGRSPGEVGSWRIRPPLKPITLGELAALDESGVSGMD